MWENTGGSAVAGDDSLSAAVREVKEEIGLDVSPENSKLIKSSIREDSFFDVWLFQQDFDLGDVILQENETVDAKYATLDEIERMIQNGEFIPVHHSLDILW
jgi:8-oxo-dGTP pyrophosphatase MutT (NUDIX family)